jgi:hypothetical protein
MIDIATKYVVARTKEIFLDSDATTIRTILGTASLGWTIGLWLPLETFNHPAYAWMNIIASEFWWGLAMLLHFLGVTWRVYDIKPRLHWAFFINLYGAVLWTFLTGCITFALGRFTPGLALEICLITAAWVSLLRTGQNEGRGSP